PRIVCLNLSCVVCLAACHARQLLTTSPTRRSSDLQPVRRLASQVVRDVDDGGKVAAVLDAEAGFVHRHALERQRAEGAQVAAQRSEEHTSELQSREKLVCRLLLEKKKCGPAAS